MPVENGVTKESYGVGLSVVGCGCWRENSMACVMRCFTDFRGCWRENSMCDALFHEFSLGFIHRFSSNSLVARYDALTATFRADVETCSRADLLAARLRSANGLTIFPQGRPQKKQVSRSHLLKRLPRIAPDTRRTMASRPVKPRGRGRQQCGQATRVGRAGARTLCMS